MPADQHSQSASDAGYAALLARFEKQPVRHIIDIPGERTTSNERQLAVIPSRRFASDALSVAEKQAAMQLRAAWLLFTGAGMPAMLHRRLLKAAEAAGEGTEQKGVYEYWRNACRQRFLSPLMCVEVVCLGFSIDDVDTRYKMHAGTALANMHGCLGLFRGEHGE